MSSDLVQSAEPVPLAIEYATPRPRPPADWNVAGRYVLLLGMAGGVLLLLLCLTSFLPPYRVGLLVFALALLLAAGSAGCCAIGFFCALVSKPSYPRNSRKNLRRSGVIVLLGGASIAVMALPNDLFAFYSFDAAAFEAARREAETTLTQTGWPERFDRTVAGYHVDMVGRDANGGLWFRTDTQADMIDQVSYGFYYQPPGATLELSQRGGYPTSPFGAADLQITPLQGRWFRFEANDDFH